MPSPTQKPNFSLLAALSLALAGCSGAGPVPAQDPPLAGADIGGPFELVDQHGNTVRWEDFAGRYRMVYFGFTYCPDICPTDVGRMVHGLGRLEKQDAAKANKIVPIFISVDPERDTPAVMGEFTAAFSDKLIGLTGTPEQIKVAADAFRVYYSRGEDTPGGGYLVDHSAVVYLFGPQGEPLATLPVDKGADAVAVELAKWVR